MCWHKWKEAKRNTIAPKIRLTSGSLGSMTLYDLSADEKRLLFGLTIIELKCVKCEKLKHIEVIGNI